MVYITDKRTQNKIFGLFGEGQPVWGLTRLVSYPLFFSSKITIGHKPSSCIGAGGTLHILIK